MKKLLIVAAIAALGASCANAADMAAKPMYTKAPMAVPMYNWGGWYVGGNVGYSWMGNRSPDISFTDPGGLIGFGPFFAAPANNVFGPINPKGVIGGVQGGFNWQLSNFVLGVVGDFQFSDIKASSNRVDPAAIAVQSVGMRIDHFSTLRVKLGYAFGNFQIYGTGGLAVADVNSTLGFGIIANGRQFTGSNNVWKAGWTAGVGGEMLLGRSWIIGVEYLHYDVGSVGLTALPGITPSVSLATISANQKVDGDLVRGTLSYKF